MLTFTRTTVRVAALVVFFAADPESGMAQLPTWADEFRIGTNDHGDQREPAVSSSSDGSFVVVWQSISARDPDPGIRGRVFDRQGRVLGAEFAVSVPVEPAGPPTVGMNGAGDFLVAWCAQTVGLGRVFAQFFGHTRRGDAFEVARDCGFTEVATSIGSGDFLLSWLGHAQRFDADGLTSGDRMVLPISENGTGLPSERPARVAMAAAGHFVLAMTDYGPYGWGYPSVVQARLFQSDGDASGAPIRVSAGTFHTHGPVAMAPDGRFVLVWNAVERPVAGAPGNRITMVGTPFGARVKLTDGHFARTSAVAIGPQGEHFVAWPAINGTVRGTLFNQGNVVGPFPVSSSGRIGTAPSVASVGAGGFVVVWQSGSAIFGRLIRGEEPPAAGALLDIDGNGAIGAFTDGLLVVRYLLGFRGAPLTSGAISPSCVRCDATSVAEYLAGLSPLLDADGNLTVTPFTDGILILRYLLGFTGPTLIYGALAGDCTRCDPGEIAEYLATLL